MASVALASTALTNAVVYATKATTPATFLSGMSLLTFVTTLGTYVLSDGFAKLMRTQKFTKKIQNFFDQVGFYPFDYVIDAIIGFVYALNANREEAAKRKKERKKRKSLAAKMSRQYEDHDKNADNNNAAGEVEYYDVEPEYDDDYDYDYDYKKDYDDSKKDYQYRDHPYRSYYEKGYADDGKNKAQQNKKNYGAKISKR